MLWYELLYQRGRTHLSGGARKNWKSTRVVKNMNVTQMKATWQIVNQGNKAFNLTTGRPVSETGKPGDNLAADVQGRAWNLEGVHLLQHDGGEHADDDLLSLVWLGEGMVEGVQVGGRDQRRILQVWPWKLMSVPETCKIIVPNEETGDHDERKTWTWARTTTRN